MKFLQLDEIKHQCRVDFDYDDERLIAYGNTAEETMAQYLGRGKTVDAMMASLQEEYGQMPESIKTAALMLVATWYQHQVPTSQSNMSIVPYTFDLIVKPYMIL